MSKRKLAEYIGPSTSATKSEKSSNDVQHRVQGILANGTILVTRALKTGRGFERQKLGRRQKTANAGADRAEMRRLEDEVLALKALDLAKVGEAHIYKSIARTSIITKAPALARRAQKIVSNIPIPKDSANANVQARLFNTAVVKAAMDDLMRQLRTALGLDEKVKEGKKRLRARDYQQKVNIEDDKHSNATESNQQAQSPPKKGRLSVAESDEIDLSMDDYDELEARIADSDSDSALSDLEGVQQQRHDDSDWSGSETDGEEAKDDTDEARPATRSLKKDTSQEGGHTAPQSTTYLPSLSMGGYWSGSESGSEPAALDDENDRSQRKNRRGQRARRKIAEAKYKEKAVHIQNEAQSRDAGWDAKKGAQSKDAKYGKRSGPGTRSTGRGGRSTRGPEHSGANSDPVGSRSKAKAVLEGPIHPSWEAARKAKQQKTMVAFQGKSMTF